MSSQRRLLEQPVDGDDVDKEEQEGEEEDEEEEDEQENAGVRQEGEHEQGVPYDERISLTPDDLFAMPYEFEFLDQDWTVQRLANGLFLQRLLPTARVYDNVGRCIMFAYTAREKDGTRIVVINCWKQWRNVTTRYGLLKKKFRRLRDVHHDPLTSPDPVRIHLDL
ncbi:hypothetical protein CBR_g45785 [Chara braunii]|uniref:Uncharacterized protein n=1 Tax=Chara braunii TaxID=69332 RepID=A0A388LZH1_CHABU|nr:hypothetical protein CBR_g45785 [Chara braunii]|eukprot:GBG87632.1 hypothetical protein CBR_g45785 [Chara braunii]